MLCIYEKVRKEASPLFESVRASRKDGFRPDFRCANVGRERELSFALFVSFCSFRVTDVPALVRCHCRYGATSLASQNPENPTQKEYSAEVRQVSAQETRLATLKVRIDEVRNHLGQVGARIHAAEVQFRAGTNAGCRQEDDA